MQSIFILLQNHSACFGCQLHPSSGVRETVTTASGTGQRICAATSLQRGQINIKKQVLTTICKLTLLPATVSIGFSAWSLVQDHGRRARIAMALCDIVYKGIC
jgi:hypothetical protein